MLKPPIPRMGGKSRLRNTIIEMIPQHECYIELFFGAGWVYFGKEKSKVEVINDNEKVREWYKDFNIIETKVNYSISRDKKGRGKYNELIITNY